MKKTLAISSVLLGVVFLAGCAQQLVNQTQPTIPAHVEQTPITNQSVVTQLAPDINSQQDNLVNNRIDVKNSNGIIESYSISYPIGWDKTDFGMTYGEQRIQLIKKFATNNKNYVCVDFGFRTADFYKHYEDPDESKLDGGLIVKDFSNGYSFYSFKSNSTGYLVDKDVKNVTSLQNNVKLQASVMFNCIQGDIDNLTINHDQQINSKEYQEAISIIESLVKNLK